MVTDVSLKHLFGKTSAAGAPHVATGVLHRRIVTITIIVIIIVVVVVVVVVVVLFLRACFDARLGRYIMAGGRNPSIRSLQRHTNGTGHLMAREKGSIIHEQKIDGYTSAWPQPPGH